MFHTRRIPRNYSGGFAFLLDDYPGAVAAYSLRLLDSTYAGNDIRVRRSSDNAEQDEGFAANILDIATMETFCGAGDGFTVTWYDQSGNGYDPTQATAGLQPQVVSSGSTLVDANGLPRISFATANTRLLVNGGTAYSQPNTVFLVCKPLADAVVRIPVQGYTTSTADTNTLFQQSAPEWAVRAPTNQTRSVAAIANAQQLAAALFNGGSSWTSVDGSYEAMGDPGANDHIAIIIGANYYGGGDWGSDVSEYVFYNSDESANRTGIEANINGYYTIY